MILCIVLAYAMNITGNLICHFNAYSLQSYESWNNIFWSFLPWIHTNGIFFLLWILLHHQHTLPFNLLSFFCITWEAEANRVLSDTPVIFNYKNRQLFLLINQLLILNSTFHL